MTAGLIIRLLFGILFLTPAGEAVMLSLPFLILTILKVRTETCMEKDDETNKPVYTKKADMINIFTKVYKGFVILLFGFIIFTFGTVINFPEILVYHYIDDFRGTPVEKPVRHLFLLLDSWIIALLIPFLIILTVKIITKRRMTTSDDTQRSVYQKRSEVIDPCFKVFSILAAVILIIWTVQFFVASFHV